MFKGAFGGRKKDFNGDHGENPECVAVREEIMLAVFTEGGSRPESVSAHLDTCPACRSWEAEVKRMHGLCHSAGASGAPSLLTSSALKSGMQAPAPSARNHGRQGPAVERTSDQGALFVVALAIILFNVILALELEGMARVIYPAAGFVLMLASTLWVYVDSRRRSMPVAFWTALQPFTIPAGLIAYLACRRNASVRCPDCGKTAPASDRFCSRCGRGLAAFCCGCGRAVRREFRVCPFCGTRLEECVPREDDSGRSCGWSTAQIAFVAGVNVLLFAMFLAAILRWGTRDASVTSFLYLFGFFPAFNWVAVDSRRRGMSTVCWGTLILFTLYAGLVIYLGCRKDERIVCPVCGSHPPSSFNYCPCCGSIIGESCPSCGAASRGGRFCAFCGAELFSEASSPRSPE